MDPWDIIGWGILVIVIFCVAGAVAGALVAFFRTRKESRRWKRAHAGKLQCEDKTCEKIAEVRTQSGFFCQDDSRRNSRFSTFSFAIPLDYRIKEKS